MVWTAVNRIKVERAEDGERVVEAFRHRAGKVDLQPGFAGFELWREEEGREILVLTRWTRREDFRAWVTGPAFREAHARAPGTPGDSSGALYEVVIGAGER